MGDRHRGRGWKWLLVIAVLAVAVGVAILALILIPIRTIGILVTTFALIIAGAIIYLFVLVWRSSMTRLRPVDDYDGTRFERFNDSLAALSLGVGIQAPGLIVMKAGFPDAWVATFGTGHVIAVSPSLLSMDLTDQEVEAIMAASLARMIDKRIVPSWPDVYKELDLPPDIMAQAGDITLSDRASYYIWALRADTLAARLTGQPHTLQSAITKVNEVLERMPQRTMYGTQLWFVEPLVVGPFMRSGSKVRMELTRLRLENLERIEVGKVPAFSELRGGRPVVGPKGWE